MLARMRHKAANRIHSRILVALLGLFVLGFLIANLDNRDPSSVVFADTPSTLWAWGFSNEGQLGSHSSCTPFDIGLVCALLGRHTPTQEWTGAADWSAAAAGDLHPVALKSDGTLWAWGDNEVGQLGDGTTNDKHTPTQESTGATNWSSIAAGGSHTVALRSDGTLWAQGWNSYGRLGDGTFEDKHTPTQIGSPESAVPHDANSSIP